MENTKISVRGSGDLKENSKAEAPNGLITIQGMKNIPLEAKDLFCLCLAQRHVTEDNQYEFTVNGDAFAELMGIEGPNAFEKRKKVMHKLAQIQLRIEDKGEKTFRIYPIFLESDCSADDNQITLVLNPYLSDLYLYIQSKLPQNHNQDICPPQIC